VHRADGEEEYLTIHFSDDVKTQDLTPDPPETGEARRKIAIFSLICAAYIGYGSLTALNYSAYNFVGSME
jgi:hypothetical protein